MLVCFVAVLVLHHAVALQCPPGISAFAADTNVSYYKCIEGEAVESYCLQGQSYDRYFGKCVKVSASRLRKRGLGARKSIIDVDSLGRIVTLGTLYDARQDKIWNGFSMWSEKEIKENSIVKKQEYSKTEVFIETSFKDRAALFNLDAEIKLSFLSGLIDVEGSAHYLRDTRETNEKVRVNIDYFARTYSETIPQSLPLTYPQHCKNIGKNDGPTHVISSVTHGMRAVFVFEKTSSKSSSVEEVSGSLSVAVKSIPSFSIEGSAVVDVNGTEVKNIETIEVKFYGDIILENNPTNYIDAAKVVREISSIGKEAKYKSVLGFQLTPIEFYCDDIEVILLSINENLVVQTSKALVALSDLQRYSNSLMRTTVSTQSDSIRKSFNTFGEELTRFSNNFKSELVEKLPRVKAGNVSEIELVTLLNKYNDSPFQYKKAKLFLEAREREINTIALVVEEAFDNNDFEVTDSSAANDNSCTFKKDFATIYTMYILPTDDIARRYIDGEDLDRDETKWFNDNSKVGYAGMVFRKFMSYANINNGKNHCFLVQLKPLDDNPDPDVIVSIVAMKNGAIISDNFIIPDTPPTPSCDDNELDAIKMKTIVTTNPFVNGYKVSYNSLKADGNWTATKTKSLPHKSLITLTKLEPNTTYQLQLQFTTDTGHSKLSDTILCKTKEKKIQPECIWRAYYRGHKAVTASGRICQAWNSQSPHEHSATPQNYPDGGLEANYCRNPDNHPGGNWCYTTDSKRRWEVCDVSGDDEYRNTKGVTASGRKCQAWNSQSPHEHGYTPQNYPDEGLDANYCRNPDPNYHGGNWCYTTDSDTRWELCEEMLDQRPYRGHKGVTASGRKCQVWNSQSPHEHGYTPQNYPDDGLDANYCRNPGNHYGGNWCYTTDSDTRWELCDITDC